MACDIEFKARTERKLAKEYSDLGTTKEEAIKAAKSDIEGILGSPDIENIPEYVDYASMSEEDAANISIDSLQSKVKDPLDTLYDWIDEYRNTYVNEVKAHNKKIVGLLYDFVLKSDFAVVETFKESETGQYDNFYSSFDNTVRILLKDAKVDHAVIPHEMVHAATVYGINQAILNKDPDMMAFARLLQSTRPKLLAKYGSFDNMPPSLAYIYRNSYTNTNEEDVYRSIKEAMAVLVTEPNIRKQWVEDVSTNKSTRDSLLDRLTKLVSKIKDSFTQFFTMLNNQDLRRDIEYTKELDTFYKALQVALQYQADYKGKRVIEAEQELLEALNTFGSSTTPIDDRGATTQHIPEDGIADMLDNLFTISHAGVVHTDPEHVRELKASLDEISSAINLAQGVTLKTTRGEGETRGTALGSDLSLHMGTGINESPIPMSIEEVYAHEVHHAAIATALEDPANYRLLKEVRLLWNATKKHLRDTYGDRAFEIFLNKDSKGNIYYPTGNIKAEEDAAKKRYDYIFGESYTREVEGISSDGSVVRENVSVALHEFISFGRTNKQLRDVLKDVTFKIDNRPPDNFDGWINYLWNKVVNWVVSLSLGTRNKAGDVALDKLVNRLTRVHTQSRFNTRYLSNKLDQYNSTVKSLVDNKLFTPLEKVTERVLNSNLTSTPTKLAATVGQLINPRTSKEMRKSLSHLRRHAVIGYRSTLGNLWSAMTSYTNEKDIASLIYYSKNYIDRASEVLRGRVSTAIKTPFTRKLEEYESEALTRATIKLDVDSLNIGSMQELVDLLSNDTVLNNEISNLESLVNRLPRDIKNFYLEQAKSLGYMLVNDQPLLDGKQLLNAYNISKGNFGISVDKDTATTFEPIIDKLVTLYGIRNLSKDTKDIAVEIINESPEAVLNTINLHRQFKEESLINNFNGNKTQTIKGYIKEIFDPHISITVAPESDAVALRAQGYENKGKVSKSQYDDVNAEDLYLFVNPHDGLLTRQKTAMSITSQTVRGSSILEQYSHSKGSWNQLDLFLGKLEVDRITNAVINNSPRGFGSNGILVPVLDDTGKVADYRYMMNSANKKLLLKQNLQIEDVLSSMFAGSLNKSRTIEVNSKIIDYLYDDAQKNYDKEPSKFVTLSAESKDKELSELYKLLPESTKKYIFDKTGRSSLIVREEWIWPLMGFRKLSLTNIKYLNHKVIKIAERIVKEIIGVAKASIIARIFSTLRNNIISNTIYLAIEGVPIEDAFKYQLEGVNLIDNFLNVERKITDLELKLSNKSLSDDEVRDIKGEISVLKNEQNKNQIAPLIKANLFQTIVEDLDTPDVADEYSYIGRFQKWAKPFTKTEIGQILKFSAEHAFMVKGTPIYDFTMKVTQYSDFASRYALYKHRVVNNNMSAEESIQKGIEMFINYELPNSPVLQYAEDHGMIMFTRYPIRIMKALYNTSLERPLSAFLGFFLLDRMFGMDISEPSDSVPGFNPTTIFDMPDRLMTGLTPYGLVHTMDLVSPQ